MARRNIFKTADSVAGKINPHYDINADELKILAIMAQKGELCEAIIAAFRYGYVLGTRAAQSEKIKALPCANTDRASRKPTTERA